MSFFTREDTIIPRCVYNIPKFNIILYPYTAVSLTVTGGLVLVGCMRGFPGLVG